MSAASSELSMICTYARRLSILALLVAPAFVAAQNLTPRDVDARLDNQLYEVLRLGTELYNRGAKDACYRLYQGSLLSIVGFLDHRPDQAEQIHRALQASDALTNASERAFVLRKAIDDLRATFKPTPAATSRTLWDRLGGETRVTSLVDDFMTRALANPRVNFTRRGTGREWDANPENVRRVKQALVQWLSGETGGPTRYPGREMKAVHQGMRITEAEFNEMLNDVKASLEHQNVGEREREDLLKVLASVKPSIVEPPAAPVAPAAPTPSRLGPPQLPRVTRPLWDRLGGEPMVTQLVEHFTIQVMTDPKVNFYRQGTVRFWLSTPDNVQQLRKRMVQMISALTGGPIKYEGKDMKTVHQGMAITSAEFDALVADFKESMEKFKVGEREQEELLKIIKSTKADIVEKK